MLTKIARGITAIGFAAGLMLAYLPTADAQSGPRYRRSNGGVVRHAAPNRAYQGPRSGNGGRIAAGIIAGAAGAIILNEVARSRPRAYYDEAPGISCGELEDRCDAGQGWACRRLDDDPRC